MQDSTNLATLLAGACVLAGVAYAVFRLYRHQQDKAAASIAAAIAALAYSQRFEAKRRRWITIASIAFLGALLAAIVVGAVHLHAWVQTGLFGAVLLVFLALMLPRLRSGPTIAMDARGLEYVGLGRIAWPEIVAMTWWKRKVKNGELNLLRILVRKPARYLDGAPWLLRLVKYRWRTQAPRYGYFDIPMDYLDQTPAVIHAAAVQFRERTTPALVTMWQSGMDDRQVDALVALAEEQAQVEEGLRSSDPARAQAAAARLPALLRDADAAAAQASVYAKRSKRWVWIWNALVIGMVVVVVVLKAMRAMH